MTTGKGSIIVISAVIVTTDIITNIIISIRTKVAIRSAPVMVPISTRPSENTTDSILSDGDFDETFL